MNQQDSPASIDDVVAAATEAGTALARSSREERARMLESIASAIDAATDELVLIADRETFLGIDLLRAEVERTTGQLCFFADVLRDGEYLELATDTDRGTEVQHRMLIPVGVAAVFGSSNFPFAYGVAGGDTASALAAGCAVIVKEHPSHPETCRAVLAAIRDGLRAVGMVEEVVSLVQGFEAGVMLVEHPGVRAVGFTGSVRGGRALFDLCAGRAKPIPFYGELGSLNPVVVTPGAASQRAEALGDLLAESMTRRGGQMCTQPGLIFVPEGVDGDAVVEAMSAYLDQLPGYRLLNDTVRAQFGVGTKALAGLDGVAVRAGRLPDSAVEVTPLLLEAPLSAVAGVMLEEVFGPVSLVLRYQDMADVVALLGRSESALVGAIHAEAAEAETVDALLPALSEVTGRMVWGAATTGLAVGWATHHGGGYPASTSLHSSVGSSAIRRWLRPISYQGFPDEFTPAEIRSTELPRRVDGTYRR